MHLIFDMKIADEIGVPRSPSLQVDKNIIKLVPAFIWLTVRSWELFWWLDKFIQLMNLFIIHQYYYRKLYLFFFSTWIYWYLCISQLRISVSWWGRERLASLSATILICNSEIKEQKKFNTHTQSNNLHTNQSFKTYQCNSRPQVS